MSDNANEQLTLSQVEQLGRLLIPAFREAMRPELQAVSETLQKTIETAGAKADKRIDEVHEELRELAGRVNEIEKFKIKAMTLWGAASVIASLGVTVLLKLV